jgi:hypothetical protein
MGLYIITEFIVAVVYNPLLTLPLKCAAFSDRVYGFRMTLIAITCYYPNNTKQAYLCNAESERLFRGRTWIFKYNSDELYALKD